jgi:tetraacyldisaccharide 4'-kinase
MSGFSFFGGLYKSAVDLKNFLYDKEYFHSLELPIPVLSIGNITMGGTGKTPITDFCVKYYQRRRIKLAVVSRNYKAEVKNIAQVDVTAPEAAVYFGDEPVLLAQRNPQSVFYVGPQKFQTAKFVFEAHNPQLIIIDDGFQHRQLYRDVDLVILDATEPMKNYDCVPAGRAREPLSSLARATAILITKTNLAPTAFVDGLVEELRQKYNKPIFTFTYEVLRLRQHASSSEVWLKDCAGSSVMLVSGIAKPESFAKNLEAFSVNVVKHRIFSDHYPYTVDDVQSVLIEWKNQGEPRLVTTEKDYVKLKPLWPEKVPLWIAPLEVHIKSQEDLFYEILDQVLH